jgi:5-methylcytosine-specific restriction endonuclease McrA
MIRDRYPENWDAIATAIKIAADWRCQDCGKQCRRPGEPFDTHKRTMSVMHLDHNPMNCAPENLRPACAKCHLAHDLKHHMLNAARTRRAKRIASGQMELPI